jgi:hypothetical protein
MVTSKQRHFYTVCQIGGSDSGDSKTCTLLGYDVM